MKAAILIKTSDQIKEVFGLKEEDQIISIKRNENTLDFELTVTGPSFPDVPAHGALQCFAWEEKEKEGKIHV